MDQKPQMTTPWIKVFLVCAVVALLAGGAWFYREQEKSIRDKVENDLGAIARLKAEHITAWRKDQLEDAGFLRIHPFLSASIARFLTERAEENTADLRSHFRSLAVQHDFADVLLAAPDGTLLLSLTDSPDWHELLYREALADAFRSRQPIFIDLHRGDPESPPHISVVAPLLTETVGEPRQDAALVLISDASQFLYPLIQSWPVASQTGETLLVRREGGEVLFLNDLRHLPDTALQLRMPLSRTDVPAVMAVLDRKGPVRGKDYRGEEVVSYILPIPDSPWFIIAKVDEKEAFAAWRFHSLLILALLFGLTFCIGAAVLALWQRDKKARYRALYHAEAALRASVERHSVTLKAIGNAVISADARGLVELLNPPAEELTGWTMEEARGRPLNDVFQIINEETRLKGEDLAEKILRKGVVIGLANHTLLISRDGSERPIADSGAPIRDASGNITGVVLVFRDQTEERAAREALEKSEARYRQALDGMLEGCQIIDPDWRFLYANEAVARQGRKSREELLGRTLMEAYPGIEATELFTVLQRCMKDRVYERLENEFTYPGGERGFFDLSIEPVPEGLFILSIDITEQRLAEQKLRQSRQRQRFLADLVDNAQQPLAVSYSDGRLEFFNRAFCELTGYSREELDKINWIETLTPPEWRTIEAGILAEIAHRDKPVRFEKEYRRKDGSQVPVELLVHTIRDASGAIRYYYAFITDISERKRSEEKIRHLNAVLRALRDVNHLITQEKDRNRLLHRVCEILTETRGYRSAWIGMRDPADGLLALAESGIGRKFDVLRADLVRGRWPACCLKAADEPGIVIMRDIENDCRDCPLSPVHRETATLAGTLRHADRHYGCLIVALPTAMADDAEEQSLFAELLEDIGFALHHIENEEERERAADALRDSEARYRTLFEGSADGILIADLETNKLRYANPAICRFLGYSEPELTKIGVEDIHPKDDLPSIMKNFMDQVLGKKTLVRDLPCLRKDGSVVFADVNAATITIDGRACMVGFFRDIAERRRAEEEHEKLQAQLTQAQKMEAVGRLAGGVAHDFNNILSVIIGFTQLALDKVRPGDPLRDDLNEIFTAAGRSRDIIRQLLAFARKEAITPEVLDLNRAVAGMLKILKKLIGEDINLIWRPGKGLWPVLMDPSQLDQILANLCVNARDAIADVGKITIETSSVTIDEEYCAAHEGAAPGDFVLLAVSDDGCGMDQDILDKIFEPFFTTKSVGKGTGLGLPTVYGIVRQNNGFINVYSEPGQGTTFRIYLPRHRDDKIKQPHQADGQPVKGSGETVLVVEDELSILKLVERILTGFNYKVLLAQSPEKALKLAQSSSGGIDLLLTDVVMPEMNGRELAERVKQFHPGIKVMFMSGYTADVIAHRGVLEKGCHFIQKPFTANGLAAKIRHALDEKNETPCGGSPGRTL